MVFTSFPSMYKNWAWTINYHLFSVGCNYSTITFKCGLAKLLLKLGHEKKIHPIVLHRSSYYCLNSSHCVWWRHMVSYNLVNIDSDNGLLPVDTKPLSENNVDLSLVGSCGICLKAILEEMLRKSTVEFKITTASPRGQCVKRSPMGRIGMMKPPRHSHISYFLFMAVTCGLCFIALTHWGRDKMAAIFQTTLLNEFSWMKMYKFWLRFHWSLFPMAQLTIFQHWFR